MAARAEREALLRAPLALLAQEPDVRYAEVRFVAEHSERLRVRDGRPEQVTRRTSSGVGIRVLGARTWGFACTAASDEASLLEAARRALAVARASAVATTHAVPFPPRPAVRGTYETEVAIDPFTVPLADRLALLEEAVRALLGGPVRSADARMEWTRVDKHLVTSEGTSVAQRFTYGSCGMSAVAVGDDGRTQRRTYPAWLGGDGFQGGYERIAELDFVGNAPRVRDEAIALLTAPPCPEGTRDLILASSQLALQIHESCGHPTELDRALGSEISLAGGSFLQPNLLEHFDYGSPLIDLVADSLSPGGMGTFGWDDEGIPSGSRPLVREGKFVDYLSSRESAAALGRESTGTMRADGWQRTPLIRMVNVSLEPKKGSLEDLVADTKDGLLYDSNKSWSIDDLRLNFQFSCEAAWEIKHGKRTRLLRDPFYTGITPEFWRSCDAVCGPEDWKLWGLTNCGKGDPMQVMQVGHGTAPARFRNVTVGNSGKRA